MTVKDEEPAAAATAAVEENTPTSKHDKTIAIIREQIKAATSDVERAIFEDALKRELAAKEKASTMRAAPVAQTMNPDSKESPPTKKEDDEVSCCAKVGVGIGEFVAVLAM